MVSSYLIRCSMLDVRCSMFNYFPAKQSPQVHFPHLGIVLDLLRCPVPSMSPRCSTTTRSEREKTMSMSCSTRTKVVCPSRKADGCFPDLDPLHRVHAGRRFVQEQQGGLHCQGHATSSSRWSPWERTLAGVSLTPARPTFSSNVPPVRGPRPPPHPGEETPVRPERAKVGISRFSRTVNSGKMLTI